MFKLRGKELKCAKEFLLNHCRKSVQNSMRLQDTKGRNGGATGHNSPGAESLLGETKSPNNVTSTIFKTVNLLP